MYYTLRVASYESLSDAGVTTHTSAGCMTEEGLAALRGYSAAVADSF
jgi:hypothetical protein